MEITLTHKEEKFLNYLCWYQENKDSVTASYAWLAKKFGLTPNGVRERFRRYKKMGLLVRCQLGPTEWLTLLTEKAINWWQNRTQKRAHSYKEKRTPSIYISNNKVSVTERGGDRQKIREWCEDNSFDINEKELRKPSDSDILTFLTSTYGYDYKIAVMALQAVKRAKQIKSSIWSYAIACARKIAYNIYLKNKEKR